MQEKTWYYEKWVGRHASFPPSRYVKLKFIYSEKATKFCEIFTLLLTGTTYDKSKVEILQNFVAFSEYKNFTYNALST